MSLEDVNILLESDILHGENIDIHCNNYVYKFIEFCRNNNLFIVNGRIGENKLTCKDSSTVDYVVCNAFLFKLFKGYIIHDYSNLYSDVHCPITFEICKNTVEIQQEHSSADATKSHLFVWDPEKCTAFENNIDNSKVHDVYSVIKELRSQPSVDENDVNKVTDAICNILITSAGKTLKKRNNSCKITSMNTSNKPWFNKSCRTARRKFHLAKRVHFKEKSDKMF